MELAKDIKIAKESLLVEAINTVYKDRAEQYGSFEDNLKFIKEFMLLVRGVHINEIEVNFILIALKFARLKYQMKDDTITDLLGYIDLMNVINKRI